MQRVVAAVVLVCLTGINIQITIRHGLRSGGKVHRIVGGSFHRRAAHGHTRGAVGVDIHLRTEIGIRVCRQHYIFNRSNAAVQIDGGFVLLVIYRRYGVGNRQRTAADQFGFIHGFHIVQGGNDKATDTVIVQTKLITGKNRILTEVDDCFVVDFRFADNRWRINHATGTGLNVVVYVAFCPAAVVVGKFLVFIIDVQSLNIHFVNGNVGFAGDIRSGNNRRNVIRSRAACADNRGIYRIGCSILFNRPFGENFHRLQVKICFFAVRSDNNSGFSLVFGVGNRGCAGNNAAAAGNGFRIENIRCFGLSRQFIRRQIERTDNRLRIKMSLGVCQRGTDR